MKRIGSTASIDEQDIALLGWVTTPLPVVDEFS
jgi:hypothetical protein